MSYLALDVKQASREELMAEACNYFEYCSSYHVQWARRAMSMLSTVCLRYLVVLIQELCDPDLSESRWQDAGGGTRGCEQEEDFQLTTNTLDDDFSDSDLSVTYSSTEVIDPPERCAVPTIDRNNPWANLEDEQKRAFLVGAEIPGERTIIGAETGGAETGGAETGSLFKPPLDDKQKWLQTPP